MAGAIGRYTCHGVTLEVEQDGSGDEPIPGRFLEGLWWVRTADRGAEPRLRLTISLHDHGPRVPPAARHVCALDGFQSLALEHAFYLTDGCSVLHLQPGRGQGYAQLAPDFFAKPLHEQRTFWTFGLVKLLRPSGFFACVRPGWSAGRASAA